MEKKYELVHDDKIRIYGEDADLTYNFTLSRIRALRDIPMNSIKAGDLGGYIESESNLSQDGDAWVANEAKVYGDAKVFGDALVKDSAEIFGASEVYDQAEVYGLSKVYGNAQVYDHASVRASKISENAKIHGFSRVFDCAISKSNRVLGNAFLNSKNLIEEEELER